jgi:outer membrane protein TolC
MKKTISLIILMTYYSLSQSNPGLTECYNLSEKNYPMTKQFQAEQGISDRIIENYNSMYLPQMKLVGQAQYQSDVTKIDLKLNIQIPGFKMPVIPSPSNDQYKIGLTVNQLIWDGGIISGSKEVELINNKINSQSINSQLYGLKQRINEAYFGILVIEENIKSLIILKQDLNTKLDRVNVSVANGVALQITADMLTAEILKIDQNLIKLKSKKSAAFSILSDLTGIKLNEDLELLQPVVGESPTDVMPETRPEYKSFVLAGEQADKYISIAEARYMPKFSAFGQAMYGKPGLNLFDPDFQTFYIIGVQATWDFWSWGTKSREKEILEMKKDIINTTKSTFTLGLKMQSRQMSEDINNYEEIIQKDREIIELKKKIAETVSTQLDNGIITASEYIAEVNAEAIARLNLEIHKLELLQSKISFLTIAGETDKIK